MTLQEKIEKYISIADTFSLEHSEFEEMEFQIEGVPYNIFAHYFENCKYDKSDGMSPTSGNCMHYAVYPNGIVGNLRIWIESVPVRIKTTVEVEEELNERLEKEKHEAERNRNIELDQLKKMKQKYESNG